MSTDWKTQTATQVKPGQAAPTVDKETHRPRRAWKLLQTEKDLLCLHGSGGAQKGPGCAAPDHGKGGVQERGGKESHCAKCGEAIITHQRE